MTEKLEDLFLESEFTDIIITMFKGAAMDPKDYIRNIMISSINERYNGTLRKIFEKENKVYVGLKDSKGKINNFYLCDIPKEHIPGVPTEVYYLNLDEN